jgi:hypothetical protein
VCRLFFHHKDSNLAARAFRAAAAALDGLAPSLLLTPPAASDREAGSLMAEIKRALRVANATARSMTAESVPELLEQQVGNDLLFEYQEKLTIVRLHIADAGVAILAIQPAEGVAEADVAFSIAIRKAAALAVANNEPRNYRGHWIPGGLSRLPEHTHQ